MTTTTAEHLDANRKHDAVLLFDVSDGNPNGDPDAGNLPRVDPETMEGLVSDVSIKRKIRDWVDATRGEQERYKIYVQHGAYLADKQERAFSARGLKKGATDQKTQKSAQEWMCENFFDVRTFGAVMSTGTNAGQVRGPVQITFARSTDPIVALEHSITRMAVATEAEAEKQQGDNRTMGRKHTVPYGIYIAHGFVSSFLAKQTGFGEEDLELLWQALEHMFEHDRSAARGEMATRGLYVFKHDSELGNAHAHALFDRVKVARRADVEVARGFADYEVGIDEAGLPAGVTLIKRV